MESLEPQLRSYLAHERNVEYRRHVEQLVEEKKHDELRRLVGQRLLFGTAGIRGSMGPGYGQMNELVVIQTSQGLASYLRQQFDEQQCESRGVLIGHDARHNSARFARLAGRAMLSKGIRVRFCERIVATPVVAFGVRHYKALAGVMVTASHNPKNDNGYKVYWSNGAQILTPHDENIQRHIEMEDNLRPWPDAWSDAAEPSEPAASRASFFECVRAELVAEYYKYVQSQVAAPASGDERARLRVAYSTMHGVGHEFLTRALELAGFTALFPVECQREPDPNFPSVSFPNPEEEGALELAFETARANKCQLILANDPDADRCAAALWDESTGARRQLSGNELGALLGWWLWSTRKNKHRPPGAFYMLSTAVSSRFLESMARHEGFNFVETLTGFKYMGNEAERLEGEAGEVLFAYEEAIGYMVNTSILDKDGITAALQLAQCAAHLLGHERRTLADQLDWLHAKYGYHHSLNSYYLCHDKNKIARIFAQLQADFPKSFVSGNETFQVARVRDLNLAYDSATSDQRPKLPTSRSSFMVTFFIGEPQISFTIRTSGTEPKIKFYSEIVVPLANGREEATKREARDKLRQLVEAAVERCLAPSDNGLVPAGGAR